MTIIKLIYIITLILILFFFMPTPHPSDKYLDILSDDKRKLVIDYGLVSFRVDFDKAMLRLVELIKKNGIIQIYIILF